MQEPDVARMRKLRQVLELSQAQAADNAGMTLSQGNDMESGRRSNVTITMLNIAAALGCDAREFPTPKGKKK